MPIGVILGLCSALLTALVTEVYAHRCLAHRAFRIRPGLARVLDTYFRVVVGTDPEAWAAVHRVHHLYADTPRDPHSPRLRSPLQVLLGSAYLFATAKRDVPKDRPKGAWVMLIRIAVVGVYVVAFGAAQVLVMFLVHLVGYLGIMGMVNTVGHLCGRKPHPEASGYDIAWLAIPLLGHGYHNSHHAHPAAARTGPFDPIWPLLRAGAAAGLLELDDRRTAASCCGASASLVAATEAGAMPCENPREEVVRAGELVGQWRASPSPSDPTGRANLDAREGFGRSLRRTGGAHEPRSAGG